MDKIKLPINEFPPIRGYVHHAYPLGIILNDEKNSPWLFNNFIQLIFLPKDGSDTFNFDIDFFPYQNAFHLEYLDDITIKEMKIDILKYILLGLTQKKYIYLCTDEYYIPHRKNFKLNHVIHDLLIYGFDNENKIFNIIGYDDNHNYKVSELPYSDFMLSNPCHINLLNLKKDYKFIINFEKINSGIKQYLNITGSIHIGDVFYEKALYGLRAVKELSCFFEEKAMQGLFCDIRPFHILYEHKQCMKLRLFYLQKNFDLDLSNVLEEYEEVVKISIIIRNYVLKYNFIRDSKISNKINTYIAQLIDIETRSLKQFLDELNLNYS